MKSDWIAQQIALPFSVTRDLVSFRKYSGPEISECYRRLGLFETNQTDAAALIGIPAIFSFFQLGVPTGVIAKHLGEVVYDGLISLAMIPEHWLIRGSVAEVELGRKLIAEGSCNVRKRRVQELLGIQERRASRFLLVDPQHRVVTTSDVAAFYNSTIDYDPLLMTLDARSLAKQVSVSCPGALFALEPPSASRRK